MSDKPPRPSEDGLIARFFAPLAGEGGLGLQDDAALLRPAPGHDLVLTVDAVVAGIHFFADDLPASVARKALGVNLSDLAAKGATPAGFLLTLALAKDWSEAWLDGFSHGLGEASRAAQCPLLGGDTVQANGPLSLSITALGLVPAGRMVRRTTARPGNVIHVTGTIGDAALGLELRRGAPAWAGALSAEGHAHLVERYLHPRPRLAVAEALREHASAAMDVSDGLAGDLAKMMRASGASAVVDLGLVPLSPAARAAVAADAGLMDRVVTGGDDYEVLCTVPEHCARAFREACADVGVAITAIGTVVDGDGLPIFRDGAVERRYNEGSFRHF